MAVPFPSLPPFPLSHASYVCCTQWQGPHAKLCGPPHSYHALRSSSVRVPFFPLAVSRLSPTAQRSDVLSLCRSLSPSAPLGRPTSHPFPRCLREHRGRLA